MFKRCHSSCYILCPQQICQLLCWFAEGSGEWLKTFNNMPFPMIVTWSSHGAQNCLRRTRLISISNAWFSSSLFKREKAKASLYPPVSLIQYSTFLCICFLLLFSARLSLVLIVDFCVSVRFLFFIYFQWRPKENSVCVNASGHCAPWMYESQEPSEDMWVGDRCTE